MSVDKPDDIDILKQIGRFFRVKDDNHDYKVVEAERIVGSLAHPTKFEIHSKGKAYLISALDFFAQVNNEYISDEHIALFDETQFEVQQTGATWPGAKKKKR
jgi:hypothetical protein